MPERRSGKFSYSRYSEPFVMRLEVVEMIARPPIGVMPRSLWNELHLCWTFDSALERVADINLAVNRFVNAGQAAKGEWLLERTEIFQRLENEARWYCDPTGIMRSPLLNPLFKLFGFKKYRLPIETNSL